MSVLNEMDEFSTTIVGKQEMETEKSLLLQLGSFERREFKKANEQLGYLYRIKGTVVQERNVDVQLAFLRQMFNLVMIMFYLKRGLCC